MTRFWFVFPVVGGAKPLILYFIQFSEHSTLDCWPEGRGQVFTSPILEELERNA